MAGEMPRYGGPFQSTQSPSWGPGPTMALGQTEGVLSRRLIGYLIDIVVVFGLIALLAVAIFLLGIVTFTLGWSLYALLFPPVVAIIYNAVTIGGPAQATVGMRVAGVRVVDAATGGPVGMPTAAVHALLFYVAAGTFVLWLFDIFIGIARSDRRLGHDLLTGVLVVRRP
jgi:uncharacterized RDD family membrane protein YckC